MGSARPASFDGAGMRFRAGAPGLASSGTTWLDGDLNYTVRVEGNTFGRTGGDEGLIMGVFSGASHEGMGGTLTRDIAQGRARAGPPTVAGGGVRRPAEVGDVFFCGILCGIKKHAKNGANNDSKNNENRKKMNDK